MTNRFLAAAIVAIALLLLALVSWLQVDADPARVGAARSGRPSLTPAAAEVLAPIDQRSLPSPVGAAPTARRAAPATPQFSAQVALAGRIAMQGSDAASWPAESTLEIDLRIKHPGSSRKGATVTVTASGPDGRFELRYTDLEDGDRLLLGKETLRLETLEQVSFRLRDVRTPEPSDLVDVSLPSATGAGRRSFANLGIPFGSTDVLVEVNRAPSIVISATDARNGRSIPSLTVQQAHPVRNSIENRTQRPATRASALVAAKEAPSPVKFRWPRPAGTQLAWVDVLSPGYAPARLLVDPKDGGSYQVALEPASSLRVRFRGTEADTVTLTVIQRGVEEVAYRGDVDPGIDWEAADLAAGEYLALAQEKNGTAAASARFTLAAGQGATVTLALAEGEAEAPLELILDVAEDRELGSSLRLVHRFEAPGIQELGTEDLLVADLAARPAAPGRRRLAATLEALPAGRGLVGIEELLVEAEFVHDPKSPAPVLLVAPDFVELEVTTVDRETGAIVQTSSIEVDCSVDNTVRWSEEFDSADAPGHFRIRCPGRALSVQVESGHGYLETSVPLDASSARSVEVPLAPIPSLLVGLIAPDGDPVDWPAGASVQLHREDRPAATARAELERGGVRLWVSEGGYWTLNLPEIDGFQPSQTRTLWFGEDTEPSMVRYGIAR